MNKKVSIEKSWYNLLKDEFDKPYFIQIRTQVREEYREKMIYPKGKDIFNAFNLTPVEDVKVVIIGQDPYHGPNQAHGLCFSVQDGVALPPSLKNIYKEINNDLNIELSKTGNLEKWAGQGVLLLNNVLTVEAGKANSHKENGWEIFTAKTIEMLSEFREGIVFLLWGNSAQKKEALINQSNHLVLSAAHPSPLSAYSGFFGCRHFSKANSYLKEIGKTPIDWRVS